MALKYAILGLLEVNSFCGYDLKKYFDSSINSYWKATHSQIYRTLDTISKEGLIKSEIIQQDKHPNKKLFSITAKGKDDLIKWLNINKELPAIRNHILLQFSLSNLLTKEQILKLLGDYKFKLNEKLEILKSSTHQRMVSYGRNLNEKLIWKLTLENGIMYYTNEINWVKICEEQIENEL